MRGPPCRTRPTCWLELLWDGTVPCRVPTVALILLEDLIVIMLRPANIGLQTSKLPNTIHPTIMDRSLAMSMAFVQNFAQLVILVLLVRHTHLVIPLDLALTGLNPLASADEMLRLDARITKEFFARRHAYELFRWHTFPNHAHYCAIIHLER
jgi:hypothetical protein